MKTVIELLRDEELPGVAVVDADRKVVGIVTESDLIISDEEADLHLPHYLNIMGGIVFLEPMKHFKDRLNKAFATKVSDLMTKAPLTTVSADDDVELAGRLISEKHHNRLPVVDDDGRLVGIVTRVDVLSALTSED